MTAASETKPSHEMCVKRYETCQILDFVRPNAIRVELPHNTNMHPVALVDHPARVCRQPTDIKSSQPQTYRPFVDEVGNLLVEVSPILAHRKRWRGFHFLALYKRSIDHEAKWKPLRDFVDTDSRSTEALYDYIRKPNILRHLH